MLLVCLPHALASRQRVVEDAEDVIDEGDTSGWSRGKREEIRKATEAEAHARRQRDAQGLAALPLFAEHKTVCNGRACRPGEGNTRHARDSRGVFKQWEQPYEHREAFVQSRTRRLPHQPDEAHYSELVREARRVQSDGLVLMTAGDWDYRELVLNWVMHAHAHKHSNALVLSMEHELHVEMRRRRIPSADNSANLQAWNNSCLQRHIQAVRTERHVATAALLWGGLDVLQCDATAVLLRDPVPFLLAQPRELDILFQRDDWPASPMHTMGTAVNAGFIYARATKRAPIVRLVTSAAVRGLIEFYLRWNNIVDQYGWSFVIEGGGVRPHTSEWANETTQGTIKDKEGCMKEGSCLRVGFLPYDLFPRHGRWPDLAPKALIYHMTIACAQEKAPCSAPGIRPFRGNRQRLNRYEALDFDDMVDSLRGVGAWLLDSDPEYVSPFHVVQAKDALR